MHMLYLKLYSRFLKTDDQLLQYTRILEKIYSNIDINVRMGEYEMQLPLMQIPGKVFKKNVFSIFDMTFLKHYTISKDTWNLILMYICSIFYC